MMKGEILSRLNGILKGPWAEGAITYTNFVQKLTAEEKDYLRPYNANKRLSKVLRKHWEEPIESQKEIAVRDSLDEALSTLQLIELAIETGYLDAREIEDHAIDLLNQLLRYEAAKKYVSYYDFIGVRFLAARFKYDLGLPIVVPPEINAKAAVRFAAFRAQHTLWYESEDLDNFLGLMDDYHYFYDTPEAEQRRFRDYVKNGNEPSDEKLSRYLQSTKKGLRFFVVLMSDLLGILKEPEIPFFGIFYSYWMMKFTGYDLTEKGYKAKEGVDWSKVALSLEYEYPNDASENIVGSKENDHLKASWITRIESIKKAWEMTRNLIQESITR